MLYYEYYTVTCNQQQKLKFNIKKSVLETQFKSMKQLPDITKILFIQQYLCCLGTDSYDLKQEKRYWTPNEEANYRIWTAKFLYQVKRTDIMY